MLLQAIGGKRPRKGKADPADPLTLSLASLTGVLEKRPPAISIPCIVKLLDAVVDDGISCSQTQVRSIPHQAWRGLDQGLLTQFQDFQ